MKRGKGVAMLCVCVCVCGREAGWKGWVTPVVIIHVLRDIKCSMYHAAVLHFDIVASPLCSMSSLNCTAS